MQETKWIAFFANSAQQARRPTVDKKNFRSKMDSTVKVAVRQGVVVGQVCSSPNGVVFHSFKGIPYAVPPLGELRFKSPIPLQRFDEAELDCTKERGVSFQRELVSQKVLGVENCLFLNVYAPQTMPGTKPLPVMVYIHGGGFYFGSANSNVYYPLRFMEEQVVIVTLNYRLCTLGFLCLPEAGIWGNAGLKDQRLALQWVQENISQFNGDPKNVTLFGASSGGTCVHLHMYAEHANKLFHKAIIQSGTATMEWVFQSNPTYKAHRLAKLLGCPSSNSRDILAFLQSDKITLHDILEGTCKVFTSYEKRSRIILPFTPVVEHNSSPDKFISRPILDVLKTPNILKMPTIIGYNSSEGIAVLKDALKLLEKVENDIEHLVPRNIPTTSVSDVRDLTLKMRNFYFKNKTVDTDNHEEVVDLLSDYHFTFDLLMAIEWQAKFQTEPPLFVYRFDYVGGRNVYKNIFKTNNALRGASHFDEVFYFFQSSSKNKPREVKQDDENCTKRLCALWANFARYSHPTGGPKNEVIDFDWTPVQKPENVNDPFELDYLSIGKKWEMRKNPDAERVKFWQNIYSTFTRTDNSRLSAKL